MTISALTTSNSFLGNGVTKVFTFTFRCDSATWVRVYKGGVLQGSGYSVATNKDQAGSPGGTVTFVVAPASGSVLLFERSTPLTQETDYTAYDAFRAETHEKALDKLTVQIQDTARDATAAVAGEADLRVAGDAALSAEIQDLIDNGLPAPDLAAAVAAAEAAQGAAEDARDAAQGFETAAQGHEVAAGVAQTGAETAQGLAEDARDASALSVTAALAAAQTFTDTTAGLAATVNGDVFLVVTSDPQAYLVYSNTAGSAVAIGTMYVQGDALVYGETNAKSSAFAGARLLLCGTAPTEAGLLYKCQFRVETAGTFYIHRIRVVGGNLVRDGYDTVVVGSTGLYTHYFTGVYEVGTDFRLGIDQPSSGVRYTGGARDSYFSFELRNDADGTVANTPTGTVLVPISYTVVSKSFYKYYESLKVTADALRTDFDAHVLASDAFASAAPTVLDVQGAAGKVRPSTPRLESTIEGGAYSVAVESGVPLLIPTLTSHLDVVSGSDAAGGTRSAPKQTIPTIGTGEAYGFLGGVTVTTPITSISGKSNAAIVGYRGLPVFDGAGPVTETWFQADAATYPNMWEIDVTHGFTSTNGRLMAWEDGVLLARVASLVLCNSTAGSFYSPADNVFGAASVKLYVHASDSGDPGSNGKSYERTQRTYVIYGAFSGGTGQLASKIITGRQMHNDGSLVLGIDSLLDRCLCFDGSKHNALQESGICQDSVFVNEQPEINYLHVFYTSNGAGLEALYRNCIFIGREDGTRQNNAIYCHDLGGASHDTMTVENCLFANLNYGIGSTATALVVRGVYMENLAKILETITSATSAVSHLTARGATSGMQFNAAGAHSVSQSAFSTGGSALFLLAITDFGDITLSQSTIYHSNPGGSAGDRYVVRRTSGTGTFSAQRNLIILDGTTGATTIYVVSLNTASIGTFDDNVYFVRGAAKSTLRWVVDAANKTFAEWQALVHDTNSIVLDETDLTFEELLVGDPTNGDFRLRAGLTLELPDTTSIYDLGATESWDFNAQKVAAGAPSRWPLMPLTRAEGETFISNPDGWGY